MVNILIDNPDYLDAITNFCNMSFRLGKIPANLKVTRVNHIPKVDFPSENKQLRPIGISRFLMTLLEKVYAKKVSDYVDKQGRFWSQ